MSEEIKSKAFKRAKANANGKLKDLFLTTYSHYTVPGINKIRENETDSWNVNSVLGRFQNYPYNCDLPKPFLPPVKLKREVLNGEDPAIQLITTKSHMKDDMNRLKQIFAKHKQGLHMSKKCEVKWEKDKKQTSLPRYIAEIAEIMELDPDPYFSGTYNWYFTGGTLSNFSYGDENILLFPYSDELVATYVSQKDFLCTPKLKNADKCQLNGVLYELRHNLLNNSCRILGRFKNHCLLYDLSLSDSELDLLQLHEQKSPVPYISADLNPIHANGFCTANVERLVSIWDITKMKTVTSGSIISTKSLDDNWGSIRYQNSDPDTLIYTDRCCVHYIDTREPIERPALSLCPKNNLEVCENLCLDYPSDNSSYRYIGTYHSLLLCDNRSPGQCVQQKWTHQFKGAPLLSKIIKRGNQEIIFLASQLQRERTIILNDWTSEDNCRSYSLPFTPPSILETLQESRTQGKCLDPSMRLRLGLCNVGCTLIPDSKGQTFLFLQNSIGDIFYQGITHDEEIVKYSNENCEAVSLLESWENTILAQTDTVMPLAFSEKANMGAIFKNFKRLKWKYTRRDKLEEVSEPSWRQSLEKMSSYVDILAPELLSIWEVTEDSVPTAKAAPHQKVLNWLETSEAVESFTQSTIPTQDTEFMPTPINTQEPISVSQQEVIFIEDTDNFQQMFLPKLKMKTKSQEAKKKKYVPGF